MMKLEKQIEKLADNFSSILFPRLCLACDKNISIFTECICISCQYQLPETNFHLNQDNPLFQKFWGRISLEGAASMYFFGKGGRTQELIHNLKYRGRRDVGEQLGELYGHSLRKATMFKGVDCIVPVPLHPEREKVRGYNQSAAFADGLSKTLRVPALNRALLRNTYTETQTRKGRLQRIINVNEVFEIAQLEALRNKHVLLVDDVITTGATLEACAELLLNVPGLKLSMATIAYAKN